MLDLGSEYEAFGPDEGGINHPAGQVNKVALAIRKTGGEMAGSEPHAPLAEPEARGTPGEVFARILRSRMPPVRGLVGRLVTFLLAFGGSYLWLYGARRRGIIQTIHRPLVRNDGQIEVDAWACLNSERMPIELRSAPGGQLFIGRRAYINYGCYLSAEMAVSIGNRVFIGPRVVIDDAAGGEPRPIRIGDDVFIGARCTILPGVQIGTGSVVGAGSLVMESVPAWTVVAGVPAVRVMDLDKDRFVPSARR
jgi:acetyltransferase-like isoleucine patch superfamily enzyme